MHRFFIAPFIAPRSVLRPRAARLLPLLVGAGALSSPLAHAQTQPPASTQLPASAQLPALSNARARAASVIAAPAPVGGGVRLAQLAPNEPNQPAATPKDPAKPDGLGVPIGPEKPLPPGPAAPPADTSTDNSTGTAPDAGTPTGPAPTGPAPTGPSILDRVPDQTPTIGDVNAAEGREISEVRVVGNRVVPSDTILGQVRLQRGAAFSARQAELDRARIAQLGFFALVQTQVVPDLSDPAKIVVTYIVVENRVITGFQFVGNASLKPEDITPVLGSKTGTVLNRNTVSSDVTAIQKLYQDKGFAVLVQSAQQNDDGTLVFTLSEATISKINVTGLKKTRESLVRRQIRLQPGDKFDAAKLRQDLNRLYDTNFFDAVDPKVEDDPNQAGSVIVTFVFREKRTGQFSVGFGFDSRSKLSGFVTLSENNLRGTGQRGSASIEVGSQRNFELGTGNPFIGPKNASYDISIYRRSFFREPRQVSTILKNTGTEAGGGTVVNTGTNSFTYEEQRTGGRLNFTKPLDYDRRRTLIFGYRNERAKLRLRDRAGFLIDPNNPTDSNGNTIEVPRNLLSAEGTVSAASVGFLRDTRDLRIDPSSGGRESFVLEQAFKLLGGNTSFTKIDLDLRRYIPLIHAQKLGTPAKLVLAGRAVAGRSVNQLPPFEQYYIGGTETVRGYNTEQQFGDNQLYANAELRYRFQPRITGVLFVDSGTAYGGNFSSGNKVDLLTSFGFGVRLVTPIGPIRLDYGIGRDGGRTHFGIGSTF